MEKFSRKLITEWRKLLLPLEGERFVVAVSGGADSCSLAFALNKLVKSKKLKNDFIVAHFNHGFRGNDAEEDSVFVKEFANSLGFRVEIGKPKEALPVANLEESARSARYEFLFQTAVAHGCYGVVTGHTKNDQAETVLLNLIRGSGLKGLAGMEAIREVSESEFNTPFTSKNSSPVLVRPMLQWASEDDTKNYANTNLIKFRLDSMNHDEQFSRIKIRKKLMPVLREMNPKIVETLGRMSSILRDDVKLLSEIDNEALKSFGDRDEIAIKQLMEMSVERGRRGVLNWLYSMRNSTKGLGRVHIEAVMNLVNSRKSGRIVELPNGDSIVKRDGMLVFEPRKVEK